MFNNKLKILFFSFLLYTCADNKSTNSNDPPWIFGNPNNLNILTWNLRLYPQDVIQTNTYLENIISTITVDIIALQEIQDINSFNQLVNNLGDNWVTYSDEGWLALTYLINTNKIVFQSIESLELNSLDRYYFASRPPYILEFSYNEQEFVLINNH